MKRVTGIGGIFFRAKDVKASFEWYQKHLGIAPDPSNTCSVFEWRERANPEKPGSTVWSPFKNDTKYFGESGQSFMVNYRVENLRALIEALRAEGVQVDDKIEESEYGIFGWITDIDGNRIELWQPPEGQ